MKESDKRMVRTRDRFLKPSMITIHPGKNEPYWNNEDDYYLPPPKLTVDKMLQKFNKDYKYYDNNR